MAFAMSIAAARACPLVSQITGGVSVFEQVVAALKWRLQDVLKVSYPFVFDRV